MCYNIKIDRFHQEEKEMKKIEKVAVVQLDWCNCGRRFRSDRYDVIV